MSVSNYALMGTIKEEQNENPSYKNMVKNQDALTSIGRHTTSCCFGDGQTKIGSAKRDNTFRRKTLSNRKVNKLEDFLDRKDVVKHELDRIKYKELISPRGSTRKDKRNKFSETEVLSTKSSAQPKHQVLATNEIPIESLPIVSMISPRTSKTIERIPNLEEDDNETSRIIENHLHMVNHPSYKEIQSIIQGFNLPNKLNYEGSEILQKENIHHSRTLICLDTLDTENRKTDNVKTRNHAKKKRVKGNGSRMKIKKRNARHELDLKLNGRISANSMINEKDLVKASRHSINQHDKIRSRLQNLAPLENIGRVNVKIMKGFTFRKWNEITKLYSQKMKALLLIQSFFRMRSAKKELSFRKAFYQERKTREKEALEREEWKRQIACIRIQCFLRIRWAVQNILRLKVLHSNALSIQNNWRKRSAQKYLLTLKSSYEKKVLAIILIQVKIRMIFAMKKKALLRKIKKVDAFILKKIRSDEKMKSRFEKDGASLKIQKTWRRLIRLRKCQELINVENRFLQSSAATVIQKWIRKVQRRIKIKKSLKQFNELSRLKERLSIAIQSKLRQRNATLAVNAIREVREKERYFRLHRKEFLMNEPEKLEILLNFRQRKISLVSFNIKKTRTMYRKVLIQIDPFRKRREENCAVVCQRIYRGYRARNRTKLIKKVKGKSNPISQTKLDKRSVVIQRYARGYLMRKNGLRMIILNFKLIMIQKYARGFLSRTQTDQLRKRNFAAIRIQKFLRVMVHDLNMKRFTDLYSRVEMPINIIQRQIRTFLAKVKLEALRWDLRVQIELEYSFRKRILSTRKKVEAFLLLQSTSRTLRFDGVLQKIFKFWSNSVNRLEGKNLVKMLKESHGIFGKKALRVTDVDIVFAKVKQKNTNYLTFKQFIHAFYLINDLTFKKDVKYLGYTGKDGKMLLMMNDKIFPTKTGKKFQLFLNECVTTYMNSKIIIIQCSVRRYLSLKIYQESVHELIKKMEIKQSVSDCVKIQQQVRILLSKAKAVALARKRYKKFIDTNTKKPYWLNVQTQSVSWEKPKIFSSIQDCETKSFFPRNNQEFIITCPICNDTSACVNCESCNESYCKDCFSTYHRKGSRMKHKALDIPNCTLCHFQHATRICATCTGNEMKAQTFCDVCFFYTHSNDKMKKEHLASWLVVQCVECKQNAAQWRCLDCNDVFCLKCCDSIHRHGNRLDHKFQRLSYYTFSMDRHYNHWERTKRLRCHMYVREKKRKQNLFEEKKFKAIIIQKRWRGYRGKTFGRNILKEERRKLRLQWKQNKERKRNSSYLIKFKKNTNHGFALRRIKSRPKIYSTEKTYDKNEVI